MEIIWIIVVALIAAFILFLWWDLDDSSTVYKKIVGHEDTPQIRRAAQKLARSRKPESIVQAADMNRYNLQNDEEADRLLAVALFLAINEEDPIAYNINDRIRPDQPLEAGGPREAIVRNDMQNVHDSNVVAEMKKKYEIISRGQPACDQTVRAFMNTLDEEALFNFNTVMNNPALIEHIGATDRDALMLIIGRGKHLWPALNNNLKNIIQDGHRVCATGRFSQIMDSLTLLDAEAGAPPVTTDILRKEIMDHCSHFVKTLSEEDQKKYEEGDDEEIKLGLLADIKKKYEHLSDDKIFAKILVEVEAAF
jgi:hypothetical protein